MSVAVPSPGPDAPVIGGKRPGVMLYNLHALRAVAAILVIFVHTTDVLAPVGLRDTKFYFGIAGVDLFFVISGFVMTFTQDRKPIAPREFAVHRIIRVVPLYWAMTLAVFAAAMVVPSLFASEKVTVAKLVQSLFFWPYMNDVGRIQPLLFVGWTLNYEFFFYLVFTLSIALCAGRPRIAPLLCVALLAAIVALGAAVPDLPVAARFLSDSVILEFALGIVAGRLFARDTLPRGAWAWALMAIGFVVLLGAEQAGLRAPRVMVQGIAATFVVVAALGIERDGHALRGAVVQLLGAASYALYLSHPFVMKAFGIVSRKLPAGPITWTLALLAMIASVIVAIAIHKLYEVPVTKWLRRRAG